MTEQDHPKLSIRKKTKIYVNPKHSEKPAPQPPKPVDEQKVKNLKPVKEPKPKQQPPKPLSREERTARKMAKKLRRGQDAIASLITHWPQLFSLEHPKPLKIGVAKDMFQDIKANELDLTNAQLSAALMFYTQTPAYQEAVYEGDNRFDLRGKPCEEITDEQKTHAQKHLEKWRTETNGTTSC